MDTAYRDIDEYLDVHFRLLREDFIDPLRNGIQNYSNGKNLFIYFTHMKDRKIGGEIFVSTIMLE